MGVDRDAALALTFPRYERVVERAELQAFAAAIGETDPMYLDPQAAVAAGHPDVPVPPTYFFSLELLAPRPFGYLDDLGIDIGSILHGSQQFTYHDLAHAGDRLVITSRLVDVFEKSAGALTFMVKESAFHRDEQLVAATSATVIVRRQPVPA